MIKELLIEGQVENYILIMNLDAFELGLLSVSYLLLKIVTKILGFTSNFYRGRLFASYILGIPRFFSWSWDGIVSKFVSENTVKKIKITR